MSGSAGQQRARLAADSIYPPANSEPTEYHRRKRGCFLGGEHHGWAHPRGLPTPVLGTFPAIIDVSELFSGTEIRPHILNAALHPRLIRLFGNERAAVVGGYPRLGSCRCAEVEPRSRYLGIGASRPTAGGWCSIRTSASWPRRDQPRRIGVPGMCCGG